MPASGPASRGRAGSVGLGRGELRRTERGSAQEEQKDVIWKAFPSVFHSLSFQTGKFCFFARIQLLGVIVHVFGV